MKFLVFFVLALAYAQADVNELNSKQATIISQSLEIAPDSSQFSAGYETSNQIKSEVTGVVNNINGETPDLEEQGRVAYVGNDGQVYSWEYTAGVDGYVPKGDLLPTPPPTPELILRLLKYLAGKPQPKPEYK